MNQIERIGELDCRIVCPTESPRGLVVLCHGFGAPGTDLVSLGQEFQNVEPELKELAFVFPQGPMELDPYFDSRAWWMIDVEKLQTLMATGEFRELSDSKPAELETRRNQIIVVIDALRERYSLTAQNAVVGGFSQGAMLTTDVALSYPEPLGGLIVWSGALINQHEWTNAASKKTKLDIVQSHGRTDPILPFFGAEALRDMFQQCGQNVNFVPFNGPHTIGREAIAASLKLLQSLANK